MGPSMQEFITPLLGAVGGAMAAYVAIRSDLASLKARVTNIESATSRAHERIDNVLGSRK